MLLLSTPEQQYTTATVCKVQRLRTDNYPFGYAEGSQTWQEI